MADNTFIKLPLEVFFDLLMRAPGSHQPNSRGHQVMLETWSEYLRRAVEYASPDALSVRVSLPSLGEIEFRNVNLGAVTVTDLLYLNELIIFLFYLTKKKIYKRVGDFGANVGVHSVIMAKIGWDVRAFEPSPTVVRYLRENVSRNNCASQVEIRECAVGAVGGSAISFIEVDGNLTASHLAGAKSSYGTTRAYSVGVEGIADAVAGLHFVKMDIEGSEGDCIPALVENIKQGLDIMCEVSSRENAEKILRALRSAAIPLYSQKIGWRLVQSVDDVPTSWRDGTLFISGSGCRPFET